MQIISHKGKAVSVNYTSRPAFASDEPYLWQMLYYAAHMDEDGTPPESARTNPDLAPYAEDWGNRDGDLGFLAIDPSCQRVGAAWMRVMPPAWPFIEWSRPALLK
jgi:hypothetical protein